MTYIWPLAMCAALLLGIFTGYPVAFILAGIGVGFAFLADVPVLFLSTGVSRTFSGILSNWLLIAVPLFVFMGLVLEKSGIRLQWEIKRIGRFKPGRDVQEFLGQLL